MEVKFYAPRWGSDTVAWPAFSQQVAAEGFKGVEVYPLQTPHEKAALLQSLEDNGLELALLHAEMVEGRDFERYKTALRRNLYALAEYQTNAIKPRFINTQTGREYYTKDQMAECFAICDEISKEIDTPVIQETHRNKWSYAAHVVEQYLKDFPGVRLGLDLSHWVCVSESYLQDQPEAVELAIQHADHIHARVGHIEGPQVTDPRTPENAEALQYHLNWWDRWVSVQKEKGLEYCTITPEDQRLHEKSAARPLPRSITYLFHRF
jgi:sugar phosphate isomerase/epimerase